MTIGRIRASQLPFVPRVIMGAEKTGIRAIIVK
jgi:hypothetical protein